MVVCKGGNGADIESKRLSPGNVVKTLVLLEDFAGKYYIHLSKLRPGVDGLYVIVYEVPIAGLDDGIQPDSLRNDRSLDILLIHFADPGLAPLVATFEELVSIMVDSLLFGHTVIRVEYLVGNFGGVIAEGIDLRDIPLEEKFQLADVDESRGIRDNT